MRNFGVALAVYIVDGMNERYDDTRVEDKKEQLQHVRLASLTLHHFIFVPSYALRCSPLIALPTSFPAAAYSSPSPYAPTI